MRAGGRDAAPPAGGFTLIELLVVLIIIGVLATFVSLSVSGRTTEDRMRSESERLAELFRLASDEAQINGLEIGFRNTDDGFDFLALDIAGNWKPIEDGPFRPRQVPEPFYLELRIEGRLIKPVHAVHRTGDIKPDGDDKKDGKFFDNEATKKAAARPTPQVMILSSGEMSPFTLDIKLKSLRGYYRLEGDEMGTLTTRREEPHR